MVLCKDVSTRQSILESLEPLAIRAKICEEGEVAASLLDKHKFEAVLVDLLLGDEVAVGWNDRATRKDGSDVPTFRSLRTAGRSI